MVGEMETKEKPKPTPDYLMQLMNDKKLMSSLPNFCGIFNHLERLLDEGERPGGPGTEGRREGHGRAGRAPRDREAGGGGGGRAHKGGRHAAGGDWGPSGPGGGAGRRPPRRRPGSRATLPPAVGFCGRPRSRAGGTLGPPATPWPGELGVPAGSTSALLLGKREQLGSLTSLFGGGVRNAAHTARGRGNPGGGRAPGRRPGSARRKPQEAKVCESCVAGRRGPEIDGGRRRAGQVAAARAQTPAAGRRPADSAQAAELVPELPAARGRRGRAPRGRTAGPRFPRNFEVFHVEPGKGEEPRKLECHVGTKDRNISLVKGS
ncbi:hypothetical protein GHT09_019507 [Marmota monax]|uniref:STAR protein homodimerisation region domain-containing protein n=1 Tax=Marmota monax TaxID=9995 RepID=A0A834Q0Z8_MARMO|nr:hypothetical protein GHT09_019507 [Marmota monax]